MKGVVLSIALAVIATGCASRAPAGPEAPSSMQQPQVQPTVSSLAGTEWMLVAFQSSDDAIGRVVPPGLDRYRVGFLADGKLSLQLDCNRATGRWQVTSESGSGGNLSLLGGAMTRAACQQGALDNQIARDLARIRSFTLRDDRLYLSLEADAGNYEFRKPQDAQE